MTSASDGFCGLVTGRGSSSLVSSGFWLCTLLLGSLFLLFVPAQVESQSVGLAHGQWAGYRILGDLSEGIIYSTFNVTSVQGSSVAVASVDTYQDGTRQAQFFSIDLVTGQGNVDPGLYFAILPGKKIGDPVYQSLPLTINSRETRTYAQASRQVNHSHNVNSTGYTIDYFWDLETGIFTEIASTYVNSSGFTRPGIRAVMNETNIWGPDDPQDTFLLYTAAVTLTSSLLLATVLVARYRKKTGKNS